MGMYDWAWYPVPTGTTNQNIRGLKANLCPVKEENSLCLRLIGVPSAKGGGGFACRGVCLWRSCVITQAAAEWGEGLHWIFSETPQIQEPGPTTVLRGRQNCCVRKRRWLAAGDSSEEKEGVCSSCWTTAAEQVHCSGSRSVLVALCNKMSEQVKCKPLRSTSRNRWG